MNLFGVIQIFCSIFWTHWALKTLNSLLTNLKSPDLELFSSPLVDAYRNTKLPKLPTVLLSSASSEVLLPKQYVVQQSLYLQSINKKSLLGMAWWNLTAIIDSRRGVILYQVSFSCRASDRASLKYSATAFDKRKHNEHCTTAAVCFGRAKRNQTHPDAQVEAFLVSRSRAPGSLGESLCKLSLFSLLWRWNKFVCSSSLFTKALNIDKCPASFAWLRLTCRIGVFDTGFVCCWDFYKSRSFSLTLWVQAWE